MTTNRNLMHPALYIVDFIISNMKVMENELKKSILNSNPHRIKGHRHNLAIAFHTLTFGKIPPIIPLSSPGNLLESIHAKWPSSTAALNGGKRNSPKIPN
ncbi:hypothetical protein NPIL_33901 [Nephila pilipes]|uniref:Uncharacterized protein n=1 Tax=Nephila pilipes TaxID=299642 RepID=A0A8X6NEQ7_NEPPI|nr:hypothetical protein NPIL_33901 [Nephila pilipes]